MPVNYPKLDYDYVSHHRRYVARVKREGLTCQECHGAGGEMDQILDDGTGPWEPCGWCEGTGLVTRWLRCLWLRLRAKERAAVAQWQSR